MTDDTEAIRDLMGGWDTTFHRHTFSSVIHRDIDGDCGHAGSRRVVYVFDPDFLEEHDAHLLAEIARLSALIDTAKAALTLPLDTERVYDNPAGRALWKARCRDMALAALSAPDPKEKPDA